jgi:hypothetical protein
MKFRHAPGTAAPFRTRQTASSVMPDAAPNQVGFRQWHPGNGDDSVAVFTEDFHGLAEQKRPNGWCRRSDRDHYLAVLDLLSRESFGSSESDNETGPEPKPEAVGGHVSACG